MPKKRFTPQYSKPQSTVHPSLGSANNAAQNKKDAAPTVNDLINSSRKATKGKGTEVASPIPSLPPQIRHLLAHPELPTLSPRIRMRRRLDANGDRLPAGPPPPKSWLDKSRHAPEWLRNRQDEELHPTELYHLPGLQESNGRSLQTMCLRQMARHWEYIREYEQNNLVELTTGLRMELLSHIAIQGPDDGIGFEGLKSIVVGPEDLLGALDMVGTMDKLSLPGTTKHDNGVYVDSKPLVDDWDAESPPAYANSLNRNDALFRLDLSGSMGHSLSFKQLTTLLARPSPTISVSIPHLTHLSLSHPATSISWRNLLAFSKHIPTLTHLSLAHWPIPTLTPNAKTAVMSSPHGKDIQYGGTNFYSHSLDSDYREAADVLRRLSSRLYALEYLDLTGCTRWAQALRRTGIEFNTEAEPTSSTENTSQSSSHDQVEGIDWRQTWLRLQTLKLNSSIDLIESSPFPQISAYAKGIRESKAISKMLAWWITKGGRKGTWVDVECDNNDLYQDFWRGRSDQERMNRVLLKSADSTTEIDEEIVLMTSLFDQGGQLRGEVEGGTDD